MIDEVLEQADLTPSIESGDVLTGEEPGQEKYTSVPFIPIEESDDNSAEKTKSDLNADAKKDRISQEEWQKRTEEAKEGEQIKEQLKETLGVDDAKLALQQIADLKLDNARKDWEMEHPIVRTEKYKDDWKEVTKKKAHLLKSGDLTYDELFALISREKVSSLNKELNERSQMEKASVPMTSRGSPARQGLDPETARIARAGGLTEADFKRAGLL